MGSSLVLFRDDLRLADNPAVAAALKAGEPTVFAYVFDQDIPQMRTVGAAVRWWLHHSLTRLTDDLASLGATLVLRRGPAADIVPALVKEIGAARVFWNRRYAKAEREADAALKADLQATGIAVASSNANLLHEPWEITSKAGEPMKVFSPFWRACLARGVPPAPLPRPTHLPASIPAKSDHLADWQLLPQTPDWASGLRATWTPGEAGALARLDSFLATGIKGYAEDRNRPDRPSTSMLSPHLRFGEISPRQIWQATEHARGCGTVGDRDAEKFLAEIGWREFSHHLLFHATDLATVNVQRRFDAFPWREDDRLFAAWKKGQTGYPLVDAGMRQLWQTGWMHNRVRMVVASFLVKHLLIDWRAGERWFWDTLVDADPANNPASWQWVAGSGADAAPYFRIFNPVSQGSKFDPDGTYVRCFVPELSGLPDDLLHEPWTAPSHVLSQAGISLGKTYPRPIVDHAMARDRALAAFGSLKQDA